MHNDGIGVGRGGDPFGQVQVLHVDHGTHLQFSDVYSDRFWNADRQALDFQACKADEHAAGIYARGDAAEVQPNRNGNPLVKRNAHEIDVQQTLAQMIPFRIFANEGLFVFTAFGFEIDNAVAMAQGLGHFV